MRRWIGMVWIVVLSSGVMGQWVENKVMASDGTNSDEFGISLAIDGDFAVVGAHRDRPAGSYSGSAYVLQYNAGGWTEYTKLLASDTDSYKRFGYAVDISDTYLIIGAKGDDRGGPDEGAAYIFRNENGSWNEQVKLFEPGAERDDEFGAAVSIDGGSALAGVPGDNAGQGSVYVYTGSGSSWTEQQILTASDGNDGDEFGYSLALSADRAAIGAVGDDNAGSNSGSVYVFERSGSVWSQLQRLAPSELSSDDEFGGAVALDGDYLVAGATGDDEMGVDAGAAYVYHRSNGSWSQVARLLASDAAAGAGFGVSVAIAGDVIAVGADLHNAAAAAAGATYIYMRNGGGWSEINKLTASDADPDDRFGRAVAVDGNFLLVGAFKDDVNGSTDNGSLYAYSGFAVTGIDDLPQQTPAGFQLAQNYPNPFNPATTISYQIPHDTHVRLVVYNLLGQAVHTLVNRRQNKGAFSVEWNGRNEQGFRVPSGVYLYRLEAAGVVETRRMIYLR